MLTSVNVSPIPFQASIDSTRLNMACRQISQALSDLNTNIPYVISNEYRKIVETSTLGICQAKQDGKILYNKDGVFIIFYHKLDKIDIKFIPNILKTTGNFASPLRSSLPQFNEFKKGDTLYEYAEFTNGIPSYGYNVFTGFLPFFSMNHEDSIVVSESLANKTCANFIDKVYIPITEYTILQQFYPDLKNETGGYFPNIGDKLNDSIICCGLKPKNTTNLHISSSKNIKSRMLQILNSLSLSELININSQSINSFIIDKYTSKLDEGYISGIRIHRLKTDTIKMLDNNLQYILDNLYGKYSIFIKDKYDDLTSIIGKDLTIDVLKKYFIYSDLEMKRYKINLKDVVYLFIRI